MPSLPDVPGVVKTTIPFNLARGQTSMSRFYIHYAGTAPTGAQLSTYCDAVSTAWNAHFTSLFANNFTQLPVTAEDLSSNTGAIGAGTTSHAGGNSGVNCPASAAVMVQFLIARRYRGGKPKIFLPIGVAANISATEQWTSAFLTSAGSAWGSFIADVIAAAWTGGGPLTHVNVSYYQGFTVVTNPITHRARNVPTLRGTPVVDPVTGYSVENDITSQRRRNNV